jgi:hypothetical protein
LKHNTASISVRPGMFQVRIVTRDAMIDIAKALR